VLSIRVLPTRSWRNMLALSRIPGSFWHVIVPARAAFFMRSAALPGHGISLASRRTGLQRQPARVMQGKPDWTIAVGRSLPLEGRF